MKTYKITLTPLETFFFGGENTFGGQNGEETNYLVKSNHLPQQTALLGFIRHQLLLQNNLIKNDKISNHKDASELIGKKSFRYEENETLTFGVIEKVSPLLLCHEEHGALYPMSLEHQYDKKKKEHFRRSLISENNLFLLKDFNPKYDQAELWSNSNKTCTYIGYENSPKESIPPPFKEQKQVGIKKNYKGITEENAYYLQTFYRLNKGYSFVFEVELNLREEDIFGSVPYATLGGEQSAFSMKVEEIEKETSLFAKGQVYTEISNNDSLELNRLVLLSDAYLDKEAITFVDFNVSQLVNFRCLKTSVEETESYSALGKEKNKEGKKQKKITKSTPLQLFKKGSVLYTRNYEQLENKLISSPFYNIGFNHFIKTGNS